MRRESGTGGETAQWRGAALALLAASLLAGCAGGPGSPAASGPGTLPTVPATPEGDVPMFSANCPLGVVVHADAGGPVLINGQEAELREFNPRYYEARRDGRTISIMLAADGTPSVVYTAPGGANGTCTLA